MQRNSFGKVVAGIRAAVTGEISGLRTGVISEPGDNLAFILFEKPVPNGEKTYQE